MHHYCYSTIFLPVDLEVVNMPHKAYSTMECSCATGNCVLTMVESTGEDRGVNVEGDFASTLLWSQKSLPLWKIVIGKLFFDCDLSSSMHSPPQLYFVLQFWGCKFQIFNLKQLTIMLKGCSLHFKIIDMKQSIVHLPNKGTPSFVCNIYVYFHQPLKGICLGFCYFMLCHTNIS